MSIGYHDKKKAVTVMAEDFCLDPSNNSLRRRSKRGCKDDLHFSKELKLATATGVGEKKCTFSKTGKSVTYNSYA